MEPLDPPVAAPPRAGAITFLPPDPAPARADRLIVRLLAAVVALLAVLVVGLAGSAWYAYHQYQRLQATADAGLRDAGKRLDQATATSRALLLELDGRQQRLSTDLRARTTATAAQIEALAARRAALSGIPADPFGKLDQMIRLNQLMADEQLLLLRHSAGGTGAAATAVRPSAIGRRLARELR